MDEGWSVMKCAGVWDEICRLLSSLELPSADARAAAAAVTTVFVPEILAILFQHS